MHGRMSAFAGQPGVVEVEAAVVSHNSDSAAKLVAEPAVAGGTERIAGTEQHMNSVGTTAVQNTSSVSEIVMTILAYLLSRRWSGGIRMPGGCSSSSLIRHLLWLRLLEVRTIDSWRLVDRRTVDKWHAIIISVTTYQEI